MKRRRQSGGSYGYKKKRTNGAKRTYSRGQAYQFSPKPMIIVSTGRSELKGMDTDISITRGNVLATTNTNGASTILNLIRSGSGSWNRIGRKVKLKSVRLRGLAQHVYSNQATTSNILSNTLRMVVVWDKQPSGATLPTFDKIFGRTEQDGTESTDFLDPINYDNMGRFQVLADKLIDGKVSIVPNSGGSENDVFEDFAFDCYVKLGRETIFEGNSEPMTIADISSGGLYVYFRGLRNISDVSEWQINANSFARLRYTDY